MREGMRMVSWRLQEGFRKRKKKKKKRAQKNANKSTNRIRAPDHRLWKSTPKVVCKCACVPKPWPYMGRK